MAAAAFRTLVDIEALEHLPYEEAIPARTTYGIIARAAALHAHRNASLSPGCR